MTLKEKSILAIAGMVVLYMIAGALWFTTQQLAWKKAVKSYEDACKKYKKECKLISEEQKWNDEYENEVKQVKMFDEDESLATTWQRKITAIAEKHNITITKDEPKEEVKRDGGVYELPIEFKWEGYLESLVKFLHELETTDEGMFDEESLRIERPKNGYLKGTLTVTCAYRKGQND